MDGMIPPLAGDDFNLSIVLANPVGKVSSPVVLTKLFSNILPLRCINVVHADGYVSRHPRLFVANLDNISVKRQLIRLEYPAVCVPLPCRQAIVRCLESEIAQQELVCARLLPKPVRQSQVPLTECKFSTKYT